MKTPIKPDEAYWSGYADGAKSGMWLANYKRWTLCREELPPVGETVWITAKKKNGERHTHKAFIDEILHTWVGKDGNGMSMLPITDTVVSWMKYEPEPMEEVVG